MQAHDNTLPRSVAWLGYGGLLPFAGLALLAVADAPGAAAWASAWAVPALQAYGAVILSFVGALHWAFAMLLPGLTARARDGLFAWSTVPALVAWPALLLPPRWAVPVLVAGFVAHYLQDRRLAARVPLPAWYLRLRLHLSAGACLSLVAGLWAS